MQQEFNVSTASIPQTPPGHVVPIVSLPGLLDLLTVLEDELLSCPGITPILVNTLRDELAAEVARDGG